MRRNFSQRARLIHSNGPKTHILGRFGPFRYCPKVDAKLAELAPLTQKFAKRSSVGTFHKERTDPLHWTQNLCFGVFWTVLLLHESR
jgi:hypothetical protein